MMFCVIHRMAAVQVIDEVTDGWAHLKTDYSQLVN
jgi:hypothetical protein